MFRMLYRGFFEIHTPMDDSWMSALVVLIVVAMELVVVLGVAAGVFFLVDYLFSKRGESAGFVAQKEVVRSSAHTTLLPVGTVMVPMSHPARTSFLLLIQLSDGTNGWFETTHDFFESIPLNQTVYMKYSRGWISRTIYFKSLQVT